MIYGVKSYLVVRPEYRVWKQWNKVAVLVVVFVINSISINIVRPITPRPVLTVVKAIAPVETIDSEPIIIGGSIAIKRVGSVGYI